MNRLRKILTLGLEKKRAWQLPIIATLLALFGLGVRWWFNSRAVHHHRPISSSLIETGWTPQSAEVPASRGLAGDYPTVTVSEASLVEKRSNAVMVHLPRRALSANGSSTAR